MCEKCVEIDSKIARYRQMIIVTTDLPARDAIAALINKMTEDKAALHPEKK